MNPSWQRKMIASDAETSNFREGRVFYLSECSPDFKASFHQAHEAIKNQCFEKLIIAVEAMKQSRDVPKTDCLDVCDLIPGMTREPWDEVPITLLAYAGYYGRQDMIDYLIQEGANVDMGSPMSGTPLIQMMVYCQIKRASQNLNMSIINHFIEKGAVLSRVLTAGVCENNTALAVSVHLQRFDIAQALVEKGLDPILGGEPDSPPVLMEYLQFGSHRFISWVLNEHLNLQEVPNFVRALLDKGIFSNRETNHFAEVLGRNPAHVILLCGKKEAVHTLLDEKPHFMKTCDPFKKTALHIAAEKGDVNTINILSERDHLLDLEARDQVGMTPIMLATKFGHKEVVVTLLQKMFERGIGGEEAFAAEGVPMKIWVLQNGYSTYFDAMHETGELEMFLHHYVDNYGNTVVHLAAESGYNSVFKSTFPLVKGTNAPTFKMLADKNFEGKTPLHLAIDKGDVSILNALQEHREQREKKALAANDLQAWQDEALEKKAWQEFWNAERMGLLHYSCLYGTVQIVKYFISSGVSPTTVYKGYTPLSRASRAGKEEIVSFLLSIKGVSPDRRNKEKGCPLLLAARNGHTKCVTILLEKGADIKAESKGYNCLMEAIKWEHQDTATAILARKDWKDTLRVCIQDGSSRIISPMRMLIQSMPDIALIVLNKCLSIRSETVQFQDAEGITNRDLQKVHYSFEFIEDHQKGEQVTSQGDGIEAAEVMELTDFTPTETTKGGEKEEREREEEGEGGGDGIGRIHQGEAETEITEEQGEGIVEEDTGVQEEEQINVDNSEAEEDVDFLWVNYRSKQCALDDGENFPPKWGPKDYNRSHHPLALMIDNHRLPLLQHPLMKRYIEYKWWRVALPLYVIYRFFYVIFLVLLTAFALTSPRPGPDNQHCPNNSSGDAYAELHLKDGKCKELSRISDLYLYTSSSILILTALGYLVIECTQVYRRKWKYFLSYENYFQISLFVLTIMFVSGFSHDCWCFPGWQWQIGALAIFLGWFNMVILLNNMPWIGIPINILLNIMFTFLKLIFLPILLIISFAIPFYMLFVRDNAAFQGEDAAGILVAFSSPFHSIAKTVMQTTGELDFDSIFNDANLLYSPMAYMLFFLFVIVMPILFQNLLIGLAVGDAGEERTNATFTNIKLQAEYVLELEEVSLLSRRWMHLPFLEFKEKLHDPSRPWWERAYQRCSRQWTVFWNTDCDTQQRIVRDNEEQSNDAMEKIKETGPVAVLKEKVNTLNKTINKMEQSLLAMERKQRELQEQLIHQFKGELIDSIQEKLSHTLQHLKSDVEKMVEKVTSK